MNIVKLLSLLLFFLVGLIVVLAFIYFKMTLKQKNEKTKLQTTTNSDKKESTKSYKEYTVDSIFNFMEFDKVQDNMIIQKKGKKFLMVIECQGVNYDLMSEIEKNSVEIGFMKVLNTIRNPIQLYIQTRTINLERSLGTYKVRLETLQNGLLSKQLKYKKMVESGNYSQEDLTKERMELIRQENLCEYGKDIISNTEKMSLNRNILRKKYYIIMSYYETSTDQEYLGADELRDVAFSDLYTKCQSIIRALSSAEVIGKVLNSNELIDLLYNAYNRDEAETFGINRAREMGFDELYVTAPDVLQKRMVALNKKIEEKGLDLAEEAILSATKQRELKQKEENLDDLISEFAKQLIDENKQYLGQELVDLAKEEVTKKSKGGNKHEKKATRKIRQQ